MMRKHGHILKTLLLLMVLLQMRSGIVRGSPPLESVKYTPTGMYRPYQIVVDGENHIWVRSSGGVHMYDGQGWTRFISGADLPGFAKDIHVDSRGQVWLATNGGIVNWDGVGWEVLDTDDSGIEPYQLQQIYVTDEGIVWACAAKMLYRWDGAEWKRFRHSLSSGGSYTEMLVIPGDDGETIWLMNAHGSVSSSKSWTDSSATMIGVKTLATMLQETADGDVLIGEGANVFLNGASPLYDRNPEGDTVYAVACDEQGYTWFFSRSITSSKGDYWSELEVSESIIPDDIYHTIHYEDAVIDHDGVIWVVSVSGVLSFTPRYLKLTSPPSLNQRSPYYYGDQTWVSGDALTFEWFAEDVEPLELSCSANGTDWTIIADNLDPYSFNYTWRIPDEIIPLGDYITSLKIVLSSADGLADTTSITVERQGYKEGFTEYPISPGGIIDACQTPDGSLWFMGASIYRYDGFMWTVFGIQAEEMQNAPDGSIWVRTEQDIMRYDGQKWEHLFDDGQFGHRLAVNPDGDVWVFCEEYLLNEGSWYKHYCRLYRYHDGEWSDEWERLGIERLYVEDLASSSDGNVWLWGNTRGEGYAFDKMFVYIRGEDEWHPLEIQYSRERFWDHQGNMWIISDGEPYYTDTLFKYNDGEWEAFPIDIELGDQHGSVRLEFVIEDAEHRFWFNSEYGILAFNGASWSRFFFTETTQYYDLVFIDRDNNIWLSDYGRLLCFNDAGVSVESDPRPVSFSLDAPYPNPFNPIVTIPFRLPESVRVEIAIYSIDGRRVRELRNGWMAAGEHALQWDSRDDHGSMVSSGIYFCRLRAGNRTAVRRMTLVR